MHPDKAKNFISRLNSVLLAVRNQNSGADIHIIGNIRNVCTMLIQSLEENPDFSEEVVDEILHNQEENIIEFYKKKYPG